MVDIDEFDGPESLTPLVEFREAERPWHSQFVDPVGVDSLTAGDDDAYDYPTTLIKLNNEDEASYEVVGTEVETAVRLGRYVATDQTENERKAIAGALEGEPQ